MNAISFLIKEHDKVRTVMADITNESHRIETKRQMFDDLAKDLIRHETMEETVWYPQLQKNAEVKKIIQHLISEEEAASKAIKAIKRLQAIDDENEWFEAFLKLKKDVEHHANEEETDLFPKIESLLDEKELEIIGKEMYQFKQEYKENVK